MSKFFKLKNLLIVILILLFTFGCAKKTEETQNVEQSKVEEAPRIEKLTIYHFNDFHCAFLPTKNTEEEGLPKWSGAATLAGYIKKIREEDKNAIIAFAGDIFLQSPLDKLSTGEFAVEIMNKLNPDIATIGNHEFDYGRERFDELRQKIKFPLVSANLLDAESNELLVEPYKVLTTKNNVRIMFIGLFPLTGKSYTEKNYNVKVEDALNTVKKYVKESTDKADAVVILSHIGFEEDVILSEKLGKNSGVHLIIGGHSHTLVESIDNNLPVPVVQANFNGTHLGKVSMEFDVTSKTVKKMDYELIPTYVDKIQIDEEINELVDKEKEKIAELFEVIATTEKPLSNVSRFGETPLGNFAVDALVDAFKADAAFFSSKMIRNSIPGPEITKNDIYEAFPFESGIYQVQMTGENIKKMLEYYLNKRKDRYLHIPHTLSYTYEVSREKISISELLFKKKPINLKNKYTVIFDERSAQDAEKYYKAEKSKKIGESFAEEYIKYLKAKKKYKPYPEGRAKEK
ncbi:MAG TPA: bifunctional UDP-sugar hydrolase/5'-nucleotidase, partial [bacterium]|nr:bifunctional UDP-sugar hydrolase/5'-nucleotidase [bacterium]